VIVVRDDVVNLVGSIVATDVTTMLVTIEDVPAERFPV
jgi:hypothetical protein